MSVFVIDKPAPVLLGDGNADVMKEVIAWRGVGGICNKEERREWKWCGRDVVLGCMNNFKLTIASLSLKKGGSVVV